MRAAAKRCPVLPERHPLFPQSDRRERDAAVGAEQDSGDGVPLPGRVRAGAGPGGVRRGGRGRLRGQRRPHVERALVRGGPGQREGGALELGEGAQRDEGALLRAGHDRRPTLGHVQMRASPEVSRQGGRESERERERAYCRLFFLRYTEISYLCSIRDVLEQWSIQVKASFSQQLLWYPFSELTVMTHLNPTDKYHLVRTVHQ